MNKNIGPLIKRLNDKLKASADASLKEHDLTFSQTLVLKFLRSQGGQTTQKEIEEHMQIAHPTVVGIISRLEKNGFIVCFMDGKNRRNKIVHETDKARNLNSIMDTGIREMEQKLTNGLSDSELAELQRMLTILYKNIE